MVQDAYTEVVQRLPEYLRGPKLPLFLWLHLVVGERTAETASSPLRAQFRDARREISLYRGACRRPVRQRSRRSWLANTPRPPRRRVQAERILRVQEALNTLDPVDREILSLRLFEELTAAESAHVLGIEESAAAKRYFRALKRLKQILTNMPGGEEALDMATDSSERYLVFNRLADEFAERYRRGEHPSVQDYVDRHPELGDEIREFFPALVEVEQVKDNRRGDKSRRSPARCRRSRRLGDYRVLREIGRGGMGVVYEAVQVSLGRHVALKVLPKPLLAEARTKLRLSGRPRRWRNCTIPISCRSTASAGGQPALLRHAVHRRVGPGRGLGGIEIAPAWQGDRYGHAKDARPRRARCAAAPRGMVLSNRNGTSGVT